MLIKRKSAFTGVEREMDLPISQGQWDAYMGGELIQKALPHLTPDQREFIMTGITAEEWAEVFGEE